MLADALEEAQLRISLQLKHPDDLSTQKLSALRSKILGEKHGIDAVLKGFVGSQLDDISDGLHLLNSSKSSVVDRPFFDTASTFSNAGTLSGAGATGVDSSTGEDYSQIRAVSRTHANFLLTKNTILQFQQLNSKVDYLTAQLIPIPASSPGSEAGFSTEPENLLQIHHTLFHLEQFRDITLHRANKQHASVIAIVNRYFRRLDMVVDLFRRYLWWLTSKFAEFIADGRGWIVVLVLKIVEIEEKFDERVLNDVSSAAAVTGSSSQIKEMSASLSSLNTDEHLAKTSRTVKRFQSQLLSTLHDSIQASFKANVLSLYASLYAPNGTALGEDSLDKVLEGAAAFVFKQLGIVGDEYVRLFPGRYKIFPFYVVRYHKNIYDLLQLLTHADSAQGQMRKLETREILRISSWIRDYYAVMSSKLGITEDLLEPRLLDDEESVLIAQYVEVVGSKLSEWVERLLNGEDGEFTKREQPPSADGEGMYCSDSVIILFQIVNQQIEVAIENGRGGALILDVCKECFKVLHMFTEHQRQMVQKEQARVSAFVNGTLKDKDVEVPGGFPEYLIMIANNHMKAVDYVEAMQKRVETELTDENVKTEFFALVGKARDEFMDVAKLCSALLVDVVYRDLEKAFHSIFLGTWYPAGVYDRKKDTDVSMGAAATAGPSALMLSIIQTLQDYFDDFKAHLLDYLFSKFSTECMEKFAACLVLQYRAPKSRFKLPFYQTLANADLQCAITFFNSYKSPKRVLQQFDLLAKLINVLESGENMVYLAWYGIWKSYKDVPVAFLEEVLGKRDDLQKGEIKDIVANCKALKAGENTDAVDGLFSKAFPHFS